LFLFVSHVSEAALKRGVLTFSSGNHGQAVAATAKMYGAPAVILMPKDAPSIKISKTRDLGAEIILYDRYSDIREEIGEKLVIERGLTLVPPYDHRSIIAGQGTLGLEAAKQAKELGVGIDCVLVPCGGGGLVSGVALAIKEEFPSARIFCVEPEGFDDTRRSLRGGSRQSNDPGSRSICDALQSPTPGVVTFGINQLLLTDGLVVSDDETRRAMATAFSEFRLVLEPGGAIALAAAMSGKLDASGKSVMVIASGGNVDPALFAAAVAGGYFGGSVGLR
jgi:threonine dehydratase